MTLKPLDLKFSAGSHMLQFTQRAVISSLNYLQKQLTSFIVLPCVSQSLKQQYVVNTF